jgi:hypothetical protein
MLDFKVSGADMGKVMEHANEPAIAVSIEDASSGQQPAIRIYKGTNDGNMASIIATGSGNTLTYTDNDLVDGASAYYFTDISIGNSRTISSPVWYRRNDHATTSIGNAPLVKEQHVYILENPVKNQVLQYRLTNDIEGLKGTVQVIDAYGRLMFNGPVIIDNQIKSITVSNFPAGTYLLRVCSNKSKSYAKFVKY